MAGHEWTTGGWMDPHAAEIVDMFENAKTNSRGQRLELNHSGAQLRYVCLAAIRMSRVLTQSGDLTTNDATFMDEKGGKERKTEDIQNAVVLSLKQASTSIASAKIPKYVACVEAFSEYPPLGRFAVRDQKTT